MGLSRRGFLIGTATAIAAPALVQRANIMAIKVPQQGPARLYFEITEAKVRQAEKAISEILGDPPQWLVIHPDRARDLQLIGVDHGRPEGDESAIVRGVYNSRGQLVIGEIERFRVYISENLATAPSTASPTASEIRAKRIEGWRQMRRLLEQQRNRRWL